MLRRYLIIFLIFGLCFGESVGVKSALKSVLAGQFSKLLGKQVRIEELEGDLLRKIVLKNVTIAKGSSFEEGVDAYADKIEIDYSLKSIILERINILPNISEIRVYNPYINLSRNRGGSWNFASTTQAKTERQTEKPFLGTNLKVIIIDGRGHFLDERGWATQSTGEKFETELRDINGELKLKNEDFKFELNARMAGDKVYNNLQLKGDLDLITEESSLDILAENISLARWSSYFISPSDLQIRSGYADLNFLFNNKRRKGTLQTSFKAEVELDRVMLQAPKYLLVPLREITGKAIVTERGVTVKETKLLLAQNQLLLNGAISNFKDPWFDLKLSGKKIPAQELKKYFKSINSFGFSGLADMELTIKGRAAALQTMAHLRSPQVTYQGYVFQDVLLNIGYDKGLIIELLQAKIFSGTCHGKSTISSGVDKKDNLDLLLYFDKLQLKEAFAIPEISGGCSGALKVSGPLDNLQADLNITKADVAIYEQEFSAARALIDIKPGETTLKKLVLNLNGEEVEATGVLDKETYRFLLSEQKIKLHGEKIVAAYPSITKFESLVSGEIEGKFSDQNSLKALFDLKVADSLIFNQRIKSGVAKIKYASGTLSFSEAVLQTERSKILFELKYNPAKEEFYCRLDPASSVALGDVAIFQQYFPGGEGSLRAGGEFKLVGGKFSAEAGVELAELSYTDLKVKKIKANCSWQERLLTVNDYSIELDNNIFKGRGAWYFGPPVTGNSSWINNSTANLTLETQEAELAKLVEFLQVCGLHQEEFRNKLDTFKRSATANATLEHFIVDLKRPLYEELSEADILSYLKKNQPILKAAAVATTNSEVDGKFSGKFSLENRNGQFKINALFNVRNGVFYNNSFSDLAVEIRTEKELIKSKIICRGLNIADKISYDQFELDTAYENGFLTVNDFTLKYNDNESKDVLRGSFPIAAFWDEKMKDQPIKLRGKLTGNDLSLLLGSAKSIEKINNDGEWQIDLHGTFRKPLVSAPKLEFKNTYLLFKNPIYDRLTLKRVDIAVSENNIVVNNLEVQLASGEEKTPVFKIFGRANFTEFSFYRPEWFRMNVDVSIKDLTDYINIKQLYRGEFSLKNFNINGEVSFPLSPKSWKYHMRTIAENAEKGPVIQGELSLAKGNMYIPKLDPNFSLRGYKRISTFFDLDLFLRSDLRIMSGDSMILTGEMNLISQINIGLRDENPVISIKGSSNYPQITGLVYFEDGYVNFFYRNFLVLNKREQEKIFSVGQNRAADPYMEFKENAKGEVEPVFFLVAQSTVYETVAATASETVTDNTAVATKLKEKEFLAIVDGSLTDLSSISFEEYELQNSSYTLVDEPYLMKNKTTGELMTPLRFQKLVTALAPSLVKSAYSAVTRTGDSEQGTREAARELVVSQGNLFMRYYLKPIERTIARETGLYDVRFKRDIGQDAARYFKLTTEEQAITDEEETKVHLFGLELVKELAKDRLYFSVDTNIDQNTRYKNLDVLINSYKLTWKIFRNLFVDEISLNYGNEYSIYESRYIPLLSLEGVHSF